MRTRYLGMATAIASLLLLPRLASAQTAPNVTGKGFALQTFEPAPAGDHFFGVPDAAVAGHAKGYFMLLGDYALNPLHVRDRLNDNNNLGYVDSTQLYLNLDGTLALWDRLLLNVDIPFALAQSGKTVDVAGAPVADPTSGKLADIRLGARLAFVGTHRDPGSLAVAGDVWLPTGSTDATSLTGDGKVRGDAKLVFSGVVPGLVYGANVGAVFRPSQGDLLGSAKIGDGLTFGAGIAAVFGPVQIGPEIMGNSYLTDNAKFLGDHSAPVEGILGARFRAGDFVLGIAPGMGFTKAPGTPQFRGLASIALVPPVDEVKDTDGDGIPDDKDACPTQPGPSNPDPKLNGCPPPPPPPPDRDGDGIPDAQDACPDVPGVPNADPSKNGCPADRDGDGIPDAQDACPDVAGVANPDPKKNGCPADRDGDGIPDNVDACPDVAGVKSEDPKKNGCPPDRDGDGIPDNVDACPDTPGVANPDPKKNGCPQLAKFTGTTIEISEQVHFQTGKAVILPESDRILQAVAEILVEHKEVTRMVIEGHTDNVGNKNSNLLLSKKRADSVRDWLVKKGQIDRKRLETAGYGQTKPIQDNTTDAGRAANRRVEFHVAKTSLSDNKPPPPANGKPKPPRP